MVARASIAVLSLALVPSVELLVDVLPDVVELLSADVVEVLSAEVVEPVPDVLAVEASAVPLLL
jgi:hypothetical protein